VRVLREFRLDRGRSAADPAEEIKVGDSIKVSVFSPEDRVNVRGISKGKGFAGVMKRHGFGGGRATHGSMFHRAPGSIGMAASPARVLKGMKMPGQMGNKRITVKNLQVVEVNEEENLLLLKGAVPGTNGTYLEIVKSK
jgi:large subunit ribosomal protein L3